MILDVWDYRRFILLFFSMIPKFLAKSWYMLEKEFDIVKRAQSFGVGLPGFKYKIQTY